MARRVCAPFSLVAFCLCLCLCMQLAPCARALAAPSTATSPQFKAYAQPDGCGAQRGGPPRPLRGPPSCPKDVCRFERKRCEESNELRSRGYSKKPYGPGTEFDPKWKSYYVALAENHCLHAEQCVRLECYSSHCKNGGQACSVQSFSAGNCCCGEAAPEIDAWTQERIPLFLEKKDIIAKHIPERFREEMTRWNLNMCYYRGLKMWDMHVKDLETFKTVQEIVEVLSSFGKPPDECAWF